MSGLTSYMGLITYDPDGADINVPGKEFVSNVAGPSQTSNMQIIDKYMEEKCTYIVKTSKEWAADSTTILRKNDIGIESDTNAAKRGDGSSVWSALKYCSYPLPSGGTTGQVLAKNGDGELDFAWGDSGSNVVIDYYDITLSTSGWTSGTGNFSQVVTINEMSPDGQYNISALAVDGALSWKYGVVASSISGNQITFTADEIPVEEIGYTIEVLEVSGA